MSYLGFLWRGVRFNLFFYFGLVTVLFLLGYFFGFSFGLVLGVLLGGVFLRTLLNKSGFGFGFLKNCVVVFLFVSAFWFLPKLFGWWFVWVLLGGFVVYKFVRGWSVFMRSMRFIEKKLFGCSLDKDNFKGGKKPSIYKEEKKDEE